MIVRHSMDLVNGVASVEGDALEHARATLHVWIDEMIGFVVSPGLGRVTIIHEVGRRSSIASATLPFVMTLPVGAKPRGFVAGRFIEPLEHAGKTR